MTYIEEIIKELNEELLEYNSSNESDDSLEGFDVTLCYDETYDW